MAVDQGRGEGHPLPASEEARTDELPEHLLEEKGEGDDARGAVQPDGDPVSPDGEAYALNRDARVSRAPHGSAPSGGRGDLSMAAHQDRGQSFVEDSGRD